MVGGGSCVERDHGAGEAEWRFAPTDPYGREITAFSVKVKAGLKGLPTGEDGACGVALALYWPAGSFGMKRA